MGEQAVTEVGPGYIAELLLLPDEKSEAMRSRSQHTMLVYALQQSEGPLAQHSPQNILQGSWEPGLYT